MTGADAATIEPFTRLSRMWQGGELSLEDFAEQIQRRELPDELSSPGVNATPYIEASVGGPDGR